MRKNIVWLVLLVLLLLWPTTAVLADEPVVVFDEGRIYVDEDVALEAGEVFNGDLGVFDGDLDMPEGSVVNGDVFVANGQASVSGRINGDLAVLDGDLELTAAGRVQGDVFAMGGDQDVAGRVGGDLSAVFGDMVLRSSAIVDGDLLVAPGTLEREAGAQVRGEEVHDLEIPAIPFFPERPVVPERLELPEKPEVPRITPPSPPIRRQGVTAGQRLGRFVGRTVSAAFLSMVFVAFGMLVVFVWPRATHRVADCIATLPVQSFGLGLLTVLIAAGLQVLALVLMIVIILFAAILIGTIILLPVGLLLILLSVLVLLPVPLALLGAMVLGWVALAELIGQRLIRLLKADQVKPLGATFLGLLVTVPLAAGLWILEPVCCAWLFVILLTSVGLGAVIHTRFGRVSCRPAKTTAVPRDEALPAEAMDEEAGRPDGPPNQGS